MNARALWNVEVRKKIKWVEVHVTLPNGSVVHFDAQPRFDDRGGIIVKKGHYSRYRALPRQMGICSEVCRQVHDTCQNEIKDQAESFGAQLMRQYGGEIIDINNNYADVDACERWPVTP